MDTLQLIKVTQVFGHEGRRYYPGETVYVTPQQAGLFIGQGWAEDTGQRREPYAKGQAALRADVPEATLEVQDGKHNSASALRE